MRSSRFIVGICVFVGCGKSHPVAAPPAVAIGEGVEAKAKPTAGPPPAPIRPVTDQYFGKSIRDPYRC